MKYKKDEYGNESWDDVKADMTLAETQTLYSVQVPLMLQIMAPLNQQKSNHFYIALGARFLFNVAGGYKRSLEGYWGEKYATQGDPLPTGGPGQITYTDDKRGNISYNNYADVTRLETPQTMYGPQQNVLNSSEVKEQIENEGGIASTLIGGPYNHGTWEELTGTAAGDDGILPQFNQSGKLNPALFNIAASGELGFRWGLGNGWGLYTGIYVDYGFLSPINPASRQKFIYAKNNEQGQRQINFNEGSLIMMQYDNVKYTVEDVQDNGQGVAGDAVQFKFSNSREDIASKFANIGAGVKLKLAFGKVAPKKQEPQIVYVDRIIRDTVVKTNTVTVRDTVVKTNTIIEKEIIRDTITIIKEVPVEIQKTMADLSNTMFDFDKYVIKEAAKGPLNSVVKWLQENPDVKVEISGHTDSRGSAEYNQKLSENRAKAVYEYFISQGVSKWRLSYAGYGKEKPIATNETDEGRAQNRRVELQIVE